MAGVSSLDLEIIPPPPMEPDPVDVPGPSTAENIPLDTIVPKKEKKKKVGQKKERKSRDGGSSGPEQSQSPSGEIVRTRQENPTRPVQREQGVHVPKPVFVGLFVLVGILLALASLLLFFVITSQQWGIPWADTAKSTMDESLHSAVTELSELQRTISNMNASLTLQTTKNQELIASLNQTAKQELEKAMSSMNASLASQNSKNQNLIASLNQTAKQDLSELERAMSGMNASLTLQTTKSQNLIASLNQTAKQDLSDLEKAMGGMNASLASQSTKNQNLIASLNQAAKQDLSKLERAMDGMNASLASQSSENRDLIASLNQTSSTKQELSELQWTIHSMDASLALQSNRNEEIFASLNASAKRELSHLQWSMRTMNASFASHSNKNLELIRKLKKSSTSTKQELFQAQKTMSGINTSLTFQSTENRELIVRLKQSTATKQELSQLHERMHIMNASLALQTSKNQENLKLLKSTAKLDHSRFEEAIGGMNTSLHSRASKNQKLIEGVERNAATKQELSELQGSIRSMNTAVALQDIKNRELYKRLDTSTRQDFSRLERTIGDVNDTLLLQSEQNQGLIKGLEQNSATKQEMAELESSLRGMNVSLKLQSNLIQNLERTSSTWQEVNDLQLSMRTVNASLTLQSSRNRDLIQNLERRSATKQELQRSVSDMRATFTRQSRKNLELITNLNQTTQQETASLHSELRRIRSDLESSVENQTNETRTLESALSSLQGRIDNRAGLSYYSLADIITCQDVQAAFGMRHSGPVMFRPDAGRPSYTVYCNFSSGAAVTEIWHDLMREIREPDRRCGACHTVTPHYAIDRQDIVKIIQKSSSCRQYIKTRCIRIDFDYTSWVSRDGEELRYWGNATSHRDGYCACGETGNCMNPSHHCNCDMNDGIVREDEGYLTDKTKLPVKQIKLGDLDDSGEHIWYTLGKLECMGQA